MNKRSPEIASLRLDIEKNVQRKIRTPYDFEYLTGVVWERLHENISPTTLKRLWGYIEGADTTRRTTLCLLAKFLGYADWEEYLQVLTERDGTESAGFVGEGYANVDNSTGSYVTYGVTAAKAGDYDLTIRFANGGSSARGYDIYVGDALVVQGASMGSTGGWTTWESQTIKVPLEKGYSELKFTSTGSEGMANIDYIGWMNADLYAGKVDLSELGDGPTAIGSRAVFPTGIAKDRYYVDFGRVGGTSAGVYLQRKNGKIFRVNGSR